MLDFFGSKLFLILQNDIRHKTNKILIYKALFKNDNMIVAISNIIILK